MTDHPSDRNFDDLSQRFSKTIYDTPRGQLRLLALQADFNEFNLLNNSPDLLDLGGGQGQFSLWCAQQGAAVTLCDISNEMLATAKELFNEAEQDLICHHTPLQDIGNIKDKQYDLVLNHAVLEWLQEPFAALPIFIDRLKAGGHLSLMVYNAAGHQWRQIMNGRTHAPNDSNPRLRKEGNAPLHAFDIDELLLELKKYGMECVRWRGIRCVHDHMHQKIRERIGQEKVNQSDLEVGLQEPFKRLGRYTHLLLKKKNN